MNNNNNLPVYHHSGAWRVLTAVSNVLCPDGKRRYARITGEADTAFTVPASVQYKGKTVSGFLMRTSEQRHDDISFFPSIRSKNGKLFEQYYKDWLLKYGVIIARFPFVAYVAEFWDSTQGKWTKSLASATVYDFADDCPQIDDNQTIIERSKAGNCTLDHAIQRYIVRCIDWFDYRGERDGTDEELITFLQDTFKKEYSWNIARYGTVHALTSYFQGLPSCCHIDYTYLEIEKLGREWGILSDNSSEDDIDTFLNKWFGLIALHTNTLFRKVNKRGMVS